MRHGELLGVGTNQPGPSPVYNQFSISLGRQKTTVLRDIAYLLLALPSSHRHELSGKRN